MEKCLEDKYLAYCIDIRRKLHMVPETCFDLVETTKIITSELDKLNIKYYTNIGKASIVAVLNEEKKAPVIGFRADIDALDINEENDFSYRSKNKGKMHACGHDCHAAILLTTLKYIVEQNIKYDCVVKAIFQADEEGPDSGGQLVCLDKITDDVEAFFAIHVSPEYESGKIRIKANEFNASCDDFSIELIGRSGHAAYPHLSVDPIQMANEVYNLIQVMKTRELNQTEKVVISITNFNDGVGANNIIPDKCTMIGTVRTYNKEMKKIIKNKMENIIKGVCAIHQGDYKFNYSDECIPLNNTPWVCNFIKKAGIESIGEKNIIVDEKYAMGVDDFAYYVDKASGAMFNLGVRNEEKGCIASLHNSKFNPDENSFLNGVKIYAKIIEKYTSKTINENKD